MEHLLKTGYDFINKAYIYAYISVVVLALIWYILMRWKVDKILSNKKDQEVLRFLLAPVLVVFFTTMVLMFYAYFTGMGEYYRVASEGLLPKIGRASMGIVTYGGFMASNFLVVGACLFEVLMIIGEIYLIASNKKEEKPNMQKKTKK